MFTFTIIGFIVEGGKYLNFQLEVFAESPIEATANVKRQYGRVTISSVSRNPRGRIDGY